MRPLSDYVSISETLILSDTRILQLVLPAETLTFQGQSVSSIGELEFIIRDRATGEVIVNRSGISAQEAHGSDGVSDLTEVRPVALGDGKFALIYGRAITAQDDVAERADGAATFIDVFDANGAPIPSAGGRVEGLAVGAGIQAAGGGIFAVIKEETISNDNFEADLLRLTPDGQIVDTGVDADRNFISLGNGVELDDGGFILAESQERFGEIIIPRLKVFDAGLEFLIDVQITNLTNGVDPADFTLVIQKLGNSSQFAAIFYELDDPDADGDRLIKVGGDVHLALGSTATLGAAAQPLRFLETPFVANPTFLTPQVIDLPGGGFAISWVDAVFDGSGDLTGNEFRFQLYDSSGDLNGPIRNVGQDTDEFFGSGFVDADGDLVYTVSLIDADKFPITDPSQVDETFRSVLVDFETDLPDDPGAPEPEGLRIIGTSASERFVGGAGDDTIFAGAGNDNIKGEAGNDNLKGEAGSDVVKGGDGNDTVKGNGGNDKVKGQAGDDRLVGGGGDDKVIAGSGDDVLLGRGGNDTLAGGGGDDRLLGNGGDDVLRGKSGADVFSFKRNDGTDRIADFVQGQDLIEIRNGASDFADLDIVAQGSKVLISFNGTTIKVDNAVVRDFDADDFLF